MSLWIALLGDGHMERHGRGNYTQERVDSNEIPIYDVVEVGAGAGAAPANRRRSRA